VPALRSENKPMIILVQFRIGILQVTKNENPKRIQEGATKTGEIKRSREKTVTEKLSV
jgi:hypothetical protein